jgi:hypothetical protein
MKKLLFLISFFLLNPSQAAEDTILFINFNSILNTQTGKYMSEGGGVNVEIEAAKKAAAKTGRKLVIFPDKKTAEINYRTLTDFLSKQKPNAINSIVISGHDGNGSFGGKNGELSTGNLKHLLTQSSVQASVAGVRSLHLLGCYTGTPGVVNEWNPIDRNDSPLPSLEIVSGFDNKSPFSGDKRLFGIVENLLTQEKKLLQTAENDEFSKNILEVIKNINRTKLDLSIGIRACNDVFYLNKEAEYNNNERERSTPYQKISMTEMVNECTSDKAQAEISELFKKISCWRDPVQAAIFNDTSKEEIRQFCSNIKVDDPPNPNGELRKIYSQYLAKSHCFEFIIGGVPASPESVLRLLFAENVFKNVMKHSRVQALMKDVLKNNHTEEAKLLTAHIKKALNGEYVTRKEWIAGMQQINTIIEKQFPSDLVEVKDIPEISEIAERILEEEDPQTAEDFERRVTEELIKKLGKDKAKKLIAEAERNEEIRNQNVMKRQEAYGKILSLQRLSDRFIFSHDEHMIPMNYIDQLKQADVEANIHIKRFLDEM